MELKIDLTYNRPRCSVCAVPLNVHGTCCGWMNASVVIDSKTFIVLDSAHPRYNLKFEFHAWVSAVTIRPLPEIS